jgi:hypothetical protein
VQQNPQSEVEIDMKNRITSFLAAVAFGGLMLVGSAVAQSGSNQVSPMPTNPTPLNAGPGQSEAGHSWENHVNQREQNQQNRIANGIRNDQMTAGQAAHLENRERAIQNREAADEAEHHGRLTPQERRHFQQAQNKVSRQIHNDKHPK